MPNHYRFIDTDSALISFCESIEENAYVAVDTEFDRRTTYYPILSLVQVAAASGVAIIDAMKVDISHLKKLFLNPRIIKIFHAGRQDIEILEYVFSEPILNVFDTQIAAVLLGLPENLSFFNIVNHFFGIAIDKSQQSKSWLNRPLTDHQLEYAYKDVAYLFEIFPKIYQHLVDQKRLSWLQEIQKKMLHHTNFNFLDHWQKVKVQSHNIKTWFRLRRIWLWREKVAIEHNKHRLLIFSDHVLILLAQYKELSEEKLKEKLSIFYKSLFDLKIWEDFLIVYQQSFDESKSLGDPKTEEELKIIQNHLASRRPASFSPLVVNRIKDINQFSVDLANKLEIPKHYLISSDEVQSFAILPSKEHAILQGWRGEFFKKLPISLGLEVQ